MSNDIFHIALHIGREIDAKADRMCGMDASFESQLDNVFKTQRSCSTRVFDRLMDMEYMANTQKYQAFKKVRQEQINERAT